MSPVNEWVCVGVCGCVWVCVGVCGCVWVCVSQRRHLNYSNVGTITMWIRPTALTTGSPHKRFMYLSKQYSC